MPKPPQLAPFHTEEQRLYSESLPDGRASHPISEWDPSHPAEKTHFSHLYPQSYSFGHDPSLMTIGEGRDKDWPVDRELCLLAQLPFSSQPCGEAHATPHPLLWLSGQSHSPLSSHSWTKPWVTWTPSHDKMMHHPYQNLPRPISPPRSLPGATEWFRNTILFRRASR